MRLFAGFDGGGTKTACVLSDETGSRLGRGEGGPSNYLYCGKEVAARSVRGALEGAFREAGIPVCALDTAYIASAAVATFCGEKHVPFFRTCIDAERIFCEGDLYPIRYAAVRDEPCVVTVAGTGAITYLFSGDSFVRVGGWGPTVGDEGSGYDIGRSAIVNALRMSDGRAEPDAEFLEAVLRTMNVKEARLIVHAIREGDTRSNVAAPAKTVCELFDAGNPTAARLMNGAADEIVLAVNAAHRRSGLTQAVPLVLSGSLVKEGRVLNRLIRERFARGQLTGISEVMTVGTEPEIASLALALKNGGCADASERLLRGETE